jgi:hypothetical protein
MADDRKYKLTCFIQGDKSTFSVLVSRDSEVHELRRLIYQVGELDRFDFRLLDLNFLKVGQAFHGIMGVVVFQADLLVSQVEIDLKSLQGRVSQFRLGNRRHQSVDLDDSTLPLSGLWEEQPPARHIHVFVQLPSRDGDPEPLPPSSQQRASCFPHVKSATQPHLSVHLTSVSEARAALAPSSVAASVGKYKQEQINHPIYNGRPIERRGPPVVIYNEHLARLKDELRHLADAPEPSADSVALTADLFHAAATIYDSEKERGNKIYNYLESLLGTSLDHSVWAHEEKSNRKTTEADAIVSKPIENDYFGKKRAAVAYLELKNELGVRGDGGLQAALSLRKYVAQEHVELLVITLNLPRH